MRAVCERLGVEYSSNMLTWGAPEDQALAEAAFSKFAGYHDDALKSTCLKPKKGASVVRTRDEEDEEWRARYGGDAACTIREAVDVCQEDYEYLRGFRIKLEDVG